MVTDPRDAIWAEAYQMHYQVHYALEIEHQLLARWVKLDSTTRIMLAIASAGSALAGLIFWNNASYTILWPLLTSASTLFAIVSKQLNVIERVKQHTASASGMKTLKIDIETLMVRMRINTRFPIVLFERRLLALRERFRAELQNTDFDLLLTRGIRQAAQSTVDAEIKHRSTL